MPWLLVCWRAASPAVRGASPGRRSVDWVMSCSRAWLGLPRWPRAQLEAFYQKLSLLRRLAPGDSGRLLEFPGLPVTTGTAATGGLSFTENQNLFCPVD